MFTLTLNRPISAYTVPEFFDNQEEFKTKYSQEAWEAAGSPHCFVLQFKTLIADTEIVACTSPTHGYGVWVFFKNGDGYDHICSLHDDRLYVFGHLFMYFVNIDGNVGVKLYELNDITPRHATPSVHSASVIAQAKKIKAALKAKRKPRGFRLA